jgi:hypothetical protein
LNLLGGWSSAYRTRPKCFELPGRKNGNAVQVPLVKLKAIYTFLEQLYAGSLYTIAAVMGGKEPPKFMKDMLKEVEEWKNQPPEPAL